MKRILITISSVIALGCTSSNQKQASTTQPAPTIASIPNPTTKPIIEGTRCRPSIETSISDGVDFLVRSQQPDGNWGTGLETRGTEIYSMVPGSHDAYRLATTALCVMALREAHDAHLDRLGVLQAHARGLNYILNHGEARRDTGDLMYNTWAHIYALQAIVEEMRETPDDPRLAKAAKIQLGRLNESACYDGGWNYYDFGAHTQLPSSSGTSFGTAAGLIALHEAQEVGIVAPATVVRHAINRLEQCRLPSGSYLYGADYQYSPAIPANLPRGAIGRTQPSNFALLMWHSNVVTLMDSIAGLEAFFQEHAFLEMGRKQPWPHQSWYQTSGYYYYFDHYYAARLIDQLDTEHKKKFDAELVDCVMPHQEEDGSWWDYAMWDYHKPYGTAFAVMTLLRCR